MHCQYIRKNFDPMLFLLILYKGLARCKKVFSMHTNPKNHIFAEYQRDIEHNYFRKVFSMTAPIGNHHRRVIILAPLISIEAILPVVLANIPAICSQ